MAITIQVQMSPGCGHGEQTIALLQDVVAALALEASTEIVHVRTLEDAERLGFRGSPTVLVDGVDVDPQTPPGVGVG
ncbi:thioredoxin family protein [Anaeromyxobacter sp. SG17]|uniref:thioredoxin family protein n=1 Tax=Anaeromyxobacter sp. SG17 TaxID=2925405 RepID=UPI001F571572|nr:thioredoxin family protein [Anaeromyxobacter sp. SG17]